MFFAGAARLWERSPGWPRRRRWVPVQPRRRQRLCRSLPALPSDPCSAFPFLARSNHRRVLVRALPSPGAEAAAAPRALGPSFPRWKARQPPDEPGPSLWQPLSPALCCGSLQVWPFALAAPSLALRLSLTWMPWRGKRGWQRRGRLCSCGTPAAPRVPIPLFTSPRSHLSNLAKQDQCSQAVMSAGWTREGQDGLPAWLFLASLCSSPQLSLTVRLPGLQTSEAGDAVDLVITRLTRKRFKLSK